MASILNDEVLISKQRPPQQSMDYAFLREEGLKHIQSLSSKLWTDHNIHDPGITALETIIYAITDLGLRTGKPVKDLLASKPGAASNEKDFFSAAEILPCSSVTVNDFRKILIDLPDIRNAWLFKSDESEQKFYLDETTKALSYVDNGDKIDVNGLYQVLLEFEEDATLGNLNNSIISRDMDLIVGGNPKTYTIQVAMPFWDEISPVWGTPVSLVSIALEIQDIITGSKLRPLSEDNDHDYFAVMDVTYNVALTDRIGVTVKIMTPVQDPLVELPVVEPAIESILQEIGIDSIIHEYNLKIIAANKLLETVKEYINDSRNLCEDFYAFKTSRTQEIAIHATLELASTTDVEQALGEMFYRIDKFLSPAIHFYSLEEMLARPGIAADEIFEGPLLKNGFIDDKDLEELKRADIIYTSDLVRIMVNADITAASFTNQVKDILAVKDLSISNFINNQKITADVKNCLKLTQTDIYKAKLSIDKSLIRVIKDSIETAYDMGQVLDIFKALKDKDKIKKEGLGSDIPIPTGTNLFTEVYYSLQNDFPRVYGIGEAGLAGTSSLQRKAQAKQLKGFLLFFEQLLANYLSQLAHVKDLFSINAGVNTTYFSQPLISVPDVSPLLKATYAASLPVLTGKLEGSSYGTNRRNIFLDHLVAQFGEDFTDFALLMYSKYGNAATAKLISNKSAFLKDYGLVSYNRARSFNYLGSRVEYFTITIVNAAGPLYGWSLRDEASNEQLIHAVPAADMDEINKVIAAVAGLGKYHSNYQIITTASGKRSLEIIDGSGVVVAKSSKEFNTDPEVETEISAIMYFLTDVWDTDNVPWLKRRICGLLGIEEYRQKNLFDAINEGFHIVENILLRPKVNDSVLGKSDRFLKIGLDGDGNIIEGKEDPYSFRLTFVFPDWPERFADADFRRYIEKIIQRETPAHILAEVYWVDVVKMEEFEIAFKAWLISNATEKDISVLTDVKNDFIDVLNTIL
jgi:hypothetical protein